MAGLACSRIGEFCGLIRMKWAGSLMEARRERANLLGLLLHEDCFLIPASEAALTPASWATKGLRSSEAPNMNPANNHITKGAV